MSEAIILPGPAERCCSRAPARGADPRLETARALEPCDPCHDPGPDVANQGRDPWAIPNEAGPRDPDPEKNGCPARDPGEGPKP